jgi:AhpD family alkylhydroperoxidase
MMSPQPQSYPRQLERINTYMRRLAEGQPAVMNGFGELHEAAAGAGALDAKTKELIALAIAVNARCDGCIAFHTDAVLRSGARRDEIMDALGVAVLMGGGPSVVYATHVVEALEQFEAAAAAPVR